MRHILTALLITLFYSIASAGERPVEIDTLGVEI